MKTVKDEHETEKEGVREKEREEKEGERGDRGEKEEREERGGERERGDR